MKTEIYYYIGIVIVGAISTVIIFSSMPADSWRDHRTEFIGVTSPDEIDEKINCLSKEGEWDNTSCNFDEPEPDDAPQLEKELFCGEGATLTDGICIEETSKSTSDCWGGFECSYEIEYIRDGPQECHYVIEDITYGCTVLVDPDLDRELSCEEICNFQYGSIDNAKLVETFKEKYSEFGIIEYKDSNGIPYKYSAKTSNRDVELILGENRK